MAERNEAKPYAVVEFPLEERSVAVVRTSWLEYDGPVRSLY